MLEISVPAPVVFHLGSIPVTNAVVAAFVSTAFLCLMALLLRSKMSLIPGRGQALLEMIFEFFDGQIEQAFGSKERGRKFFPLIMTILLFIAMANQLSVFPILFQIVFEEKPLLRLATSDLSQTLTLGLLVVGLAHILALSMSPLRHIGGFIRIKPLLKARSFQEIGNAFIELFLGLMDIIGEMAKVISVSCRLFGNLFAGDVMVAVIISLSKFTEFIVPIPFLFLGIFSGFVQAFVFTLLSLQFVSSTYNTAYANREERLAKSAPVPATS
jgi:F-type H+-transporting ATPase subunit a